MQCWNKCVIVTVTSHTCFTEGERMKKVKAILEDELVDWVEIKKWEKHEFDKSMAEYLLRAYWSHREEVQEEAKEEKKEEKKAEKKVSKKK